MIKSKCNDIKVTNRPFEQQYYFRNDAFTMLSQFGRSWFQDRPYNHVSTVLETVLDFNDWCHTSSLVHITFLLNSISMLSHYISFFQTIALCILLLYPESHQRSEPIHNKTATFGIFKVVFGKWHYNMIFENLFRKFPWNNFQGKYGMWQKIRQMTKTMWHWIMHVKLNLCKWRLFFNFANLGRLSTILLQWL